MQKKISLKLIPHEAADNSHDNKQIIESLAIEPLHL